MGRSQKYKVKLKSKDRSGMTLPIQSFKSADNTTHLTRLRALGSQPIPAFLCLLLYRKGLETCELHAASSLGFARV